MLYVKVDNESILSYGEEYNDDRQHLCHQICILLFQGLVLYSRKRNHLRLYAIKGISENTNRNLLVFQRCPLHKTKNHVKYVVFRLLQLNRLACLEGFEPPTYWFVASHSIQLSYKHIVLTTIYILPLFSTIVKAFFEICRFAYLSYHSTHIIMHIAIFSFSY